MYHSASVNTSSVDMGTSTSQRSDEENGNMYQSQLPTENRTWCTPMTDIRKSFCFIMVSDFVICTFLWIAYTQVLGMGVVNAYKTEIKEYSFETSFFDSVLAAVWRMTVLLLAYALFQISSSAVCGLMLFLTCGYTVCKIIFFAYPEFHHDQNQNVGNDKVMVFAFLLIGMAFSFAEILFLHCYVRQVERHNQALHPMDERRPLLRGDYERYQRQSMIDRLHIPHSGYDSDEESLADYLSITNSMFPPEFEPEEPCIKEEVSEYRLKGEQCWHEALHIFQDMGEWHLEKGKDLHQGMVFSKRYPQYGKVFKLEGFIEASAEVLFTEMVLKSEDAPRWNPTLLESRIIETIDEQTDIHYLVAAGEGGGLVSTRDFVNLRHYKRTPHFIFSAGCAVEHPDCPPTKNHTRAINKPGGWVFFPDPSAPDERCKFTFIMNTNLQGRLPQFAVDRALGGTLVKFLSYVRAHVQSLQETADNTQNGSHSAEA